MLYNQTPHFLDRQYEIALRKLLHYIVKLYSTRRSAGLQNEIILVRIRYCTAI